MQPTKSLESRKAIMKGRQKGNFSYLVTLLAIRTPIMFYLEVVRIAAEGVHLLQPEGEYSEMEHLGSSMLCS